MRRIFAFSCTLLFLCIALSLPGQNLLQQQLQKSRNLSLVMRPDSTNMGMTRWLQKPVLESREFPLAKDLKNLQLKGPGKISIDQTRTVSGKGSVLLVSPTSLPEKNPTNRSYASAEVVRKVNGEDLTKYNRFSVWIYTEGEGFYSFFIGCTIYNNGRHIMPTPGRFEGQHFVNVYPGKWQHVIWEIPDIYRDSVTGLSVSIMLTGSPKGASDTMKMWIDDMRLERVDAENTRGFDLRKNTIAYCHSGYTSNGRKQALVQRDNSSNFSLIDTAGKEVFTATTKRIGNEFLQLDFSSFNHPGYYKLKVGDIESKVFPIGDSAWLATAWHTLNFFYAERCGYDQPGIHQECHKDVVCVHPDGRQITVNGGWHDAADLTQGVGNTARGGMAMLELAGKVKQSHPDLYLRLLEEARWGLNWTMETRFGDGYRDGGLIIGIWSDNTRGTKDDMQTRATNRPGDNLIGASFCAMAVPFFRETDAVFTHWLTRCAIEDFQFAADSLANAMTEKNEADMYAQAAVSAMHLFHLTASGKYLDSAARYARIIMACQQIERRSDWTIPLHGFFYESRSRKRILEYFHRSNEAMLIEALSMLLVAAPTHPDAGRWKNSLQAYSDFLKETSDKIEPYGILPAAIYELDNADFEGIYHEGAQVGMPSMQEYNAQVKNGIPLGKKFFLRRFPVAYQFRGFYAIILNKAKAALILSQLFKDPELRNIGTRQLEYIVGFNPFAMSTIYGDGYDYPPLYGAYAGDVVGAVPVGIETFENEDEPYMPMQVNATYKEIWTHTTGGVIDLISKILKE